MAQVLKKIINPTRLIKKQSIKNNLLLRDRAKIIEQDQQSIKMSSLEKGIKIIVHDQKN